MEAVQAARDAQQAAQQGGQAPVPLPDDISDVDEPATGEEAQAETETDTLSVHSSTEEELAKVDKMIQDMEGEQH